MCNILYLIVMFMCSFVSTVPRIRKSLNVPFPFCSRNCWGATPPNDTRALNTPVPYVIIHHTAIPPACNITEQCSRDMRSMQNYHKSITYGDIGYNFCVGGDGVAYEGRGWNLVGIHAGNANNKSIGICLIGDWRTEVPPARQLAITKSLIAQGLKLGVISPNYKLIGHSQARATECPGEALLAHISTWKHFHPGQIVFESNSTNKSS